MRAGLERHATLATRAVASALAALVCVGATAEAEEFLFLGPAPARNYQPIQLIFLNFPFERAATVGRHQLSLHLDSAESNEIATTDSPLQSTLKFETNRTVLGVHYGIAEGWEVGIDQPFITRFGGGLDPFIDAVEKAFGAENSERDLFPDNTFGAFIVARDGQVVFKGDEEEFQPGDLWFSAKREIRLAEPWPLLAVRAAIKVPTGSENAVLGSGKPDFGLGLAAEKLVLRRLMLYLNMNVVYPTGPITSLDLTLNPIFSQSFAAEFALSRRWSALLHEAVYTSPMHGTGVRLLDGTPVEIGLGLNFSWDERFGVQLLAINNVSPVEPAADFSALLSMTLRPWAIVTPPSTEQAPLPPVSDQLHRGIADPSELPPLTDKVPPDASH